MYVEYRILVWGENGLEEYLVTDDYDRVVIDCSLLTKIGKEYEVRKITTELLDL